MTDASSRDSEMRAFFIHLAAWAVVNAGLAIWALTRTPPRYWFAWVLCGWGIGIAAHGLALWLKRPGGEGGVFEEQDVRGTAVHLFVYLAVNALLIAVNLIATPGSIWFFWPLIGWGIGLAFHAWSVYRAVLKRTVEHYALEQRLIGEITMERRAAEIAASIIPGMSSPEAGATNEKPKRERKTARKKKPAPGRKPAAAKTSKPAAKTSSRTKQPAAKPGAKKAPPRRKSRSLPASKSA